MRSVLISIHPEWCEKIASGQKTIEIRKNRPKIKTPFKVYIYQTQPRNEYCNNRCGLVIGEFVCDEISIFVVDCKFDNLNLLAISEKARINTQRIEEYANGNYFLYCWHISDLVIYDKPKELTSFRKPCKKHGADCDMCVLDHTKCSNAIPIERPPQSWCYVEG